MHIYLSQINSKIGDFDANYRAIMDAVEHAARSGNRLAVFPELSLCGYLHRDSVEHRTFLLQSERYMQMIVDNAPHEIHIVIGAPTCDSAQRHIVYNACVVIYNGRIVHRQAKSRLPNYDIFDEKRYYTPADHWETFTVQGRVCGIAICEDMWQAEHYSVDRLRREGLGDCKLPLEKIDTLIVCSASPYEKDKPQRRLAIMKKYCTTFDIDAVYVNAVGGEDGILFDGQSFAMHRSGALTALFPMYEEHHRAVACEPSADNPPRLERDPDAEIYRSLLFGIREYVVKNGFRQVVLGLSGGIDSAITATLAARSLGADNVHVLVMPSNYSSQSSVQDAMALIAELGLSYSTLPIADIFSAYRALLQKDVYDGHDIDITEQNLQARIRGMLIMAYANTTDSLPSLPEINRSWRWGTARSTETWSARWRS